MASKSCLRLASLKAWISIVRAVAAMPTLRSCSWIITTAALRLRFDEFVVSSKEKGRPWRSTMPSPSLSLNPFIARIRRASAGS